MRCASATATPTGSRGRCTASRTRGPRSRERRLAEAAPQSAGDPQLDLAIALARELLHRTGALRVSVALDGSAPAIIECERLRAIVVHDAEGARELPHDMTGDVGLPALPLMRRLPAFEADPVEGRVAGTLGGLEMLGRAVRGIAALLPGASVVAADYETRDPAVPLGVAGRADEPLVVLLGEHEFTLELDPPSD